MKRVALKIAFFIMSTVIVPTNKQDNCIQVLQYTYTSSWHYVMPLVLMSYTLYRYFTEEFRD